MPMRTRVGGALLGAAAAAAVACLATSPALAGPSVSAATWTITPGGPVTGTAGTTTLESAAIGALGTPPIPFLVSRIFTGSIGKN